MRANFCPRCGSEAESLLNLVSCRTPACRNYDAKYDLAWQSTHKPRWTHNQLPGSQHRYLGNFTAGSALFDLHSYKNAAGVVCCLARYGNRDSDCWYVDEKETEIGNLATGPVTTMSGSGVAPQVADALKEALKRYRGK